MAFFLLDEQGSTRKSPWKPEHSKTKLSLPVMIVRLAVNFGVLSFELLLLRRGTALGG